MMVFKKDQTPLFSLHMIEDAWKLWYPNQKKTSQKSYAISQENFAKRYCVTKFIISAIMCNFGQLTLIHVDRFFIQESFLKMD